MASGSTAHRRCAPQYIFISAFALAPPSPWLSPSPVTSHSHTHSHLTGVQGRHPARRVARDERVHVHDARHLTLLTQTPTPTLTLTPTPIPTPTPTPTPTPALTPNQAALHTMERADGSYAAAQAARVARLETMEAVSRAIVSRAIVSRAIVSRDDGGGALRDHA